MLSPCLHAGFCTFQPQRPLHLLRPFWYARYANGAFGSFMRFERLRIEGLVLVELSVNGDERGFFTERFKRSVFSEHGLPTDFVQDNHSRSAPGVLRGLHYQYSPPQGKLVGMTR